MNSYIDGKNTTANGKFVAALIKIVIESGLGDKPEGFDLVNFLLGDGQ